MSAETQTPPTPPQIASDQEKIQAATEAILYVLNRIRKEEKVAYHLGFATQSFDLLTGAYAKLTNEPDVDKVQEYFTGGN